MKLKLSLGDFIRLESAGGIVLFLAAVAALVADNTRLSDLYDRMLDTPVEIRVGAFAIDKPALRWINDGLMAIFFLLVGLEIKRETRQGELADPRQVALPAVAALGGMLVPAAIYALFNRADPAALRGWAIPSATDIAFALGVLALLGRRVPAGAKIFLTAVAVFDDLGAIVIIALFYTADLSNGALAGAGVALVALAALNLLGVARTAPYVLVGLVLWACVLKSGVHATLAGVAIALAIPLRARDPEAPSPLIELEHRLHPWVAFGVLPAFAFANAGVDLAGLGARALLDPVTLGIALGLFVGKQIGVFGGAWLMLRAGLARLPEGTDLAALYGVSLLCGIGFTMSLFIGGLALEVPAQAVALRVGVLAGSLISALAGLAWLAVQLPRAAASAA